MISRRCIVETGKSVGKAKKEKFNLGVQVEIAIRQLDKSEIYPENDMNAFVFAVKKAHDEGAHGTEAGAERYAHYEKNNVFSDVLQTIVYNFK